MVSVSPSPWLVAIVYGSVFGTLIMAWRLIGGRVALRRNQRESSNTHSRVEPLDLRDSSELLYDPVTGFRRTRTK